MLSTDVQRAILDIANTPIPISVTQISSELVSKGYYSSKEPNKLSSYISRRYVRDLVKDNFLVEFSVGSSPWRDARELTRIFSKIKPRRVGNLYQTNFVYSFSRPKILFVPRVDPSFNLSAMVFIHRLLKKIKDSGMGITTEDIGVLLLNFVLSGRNTEERNKIRIFMYKKPIDYSTLDLMEKLLDFGLTLSDFPLSADYRKAKDFVVLVSGLANEQ